MIPRRSRTPFILPAIVVLASLLCAGVSVTPVAAATFDPECSDPRAIAVVDLALRALGHREIWERVRFVRFSFVLLRGEEELTRRTHLWDRAGRRLRYEACDAAGSPLVAIFDLGSRDGPVYRAGHRVAEPLASRIRTAAYDAWRNDAYWLLLPHRLKEPGVCLEYGGEVQEGTVQYDRLYITFQTTGLGSGERYRADINRETLLLDLWSHAPQIARHGSSPVIWRWRNWLRRGGLLFPGEKVSTSGGQALRIIHPTLEIDAQVAEHEFLSRTPLSRSGAR